MSHDYRLELVSALTRLRALDPELADAMAKGPHKFDDIDDITRLIERVADAIWVAQWNRCFAKQAGHGPTSTVPSGGAS